MTISTIAREIYKQNTFLDHPAFQSQCILITAAVCATLGIAFSSGGIVLHMLGGQLKAVGCFCYGVGGIFFFPSVFFVGCAYLQAKRAQEQIRSIKLLVDIFGDLTRFPVISIDSIKKYKETFFPGIFRGNFKNQVPFIYIGVSTGVSQNVILLTPIQGEWTFRGQKDAYQLKTLGEPQKEFLRVLVSQNHASVNSTPYRHQTVRLYT